MTCLREPNAEPIAGYRLIEPLGSGGFGEVWKCEAPGGLFKAIKFVFGNLNSVDIEGARAEQELQALQSIKEVRHPFVLSLDRIEIVNGELVIVMELADKSLHDSFVECQSAGMVGIPRDALLRYIRDAAEALDHMNEKHNLQHLDIKPRNLFLISDRVKVADFGLVKHLERQNRNGGMLGGVTPLYAAPETFSGKISERSDQYSLAIVYQELLTGQRPFQGKNARQLAQQHMQEEPELRALPEAERPAVARALSKDPAKRFPNCLAFVRALYTAHGRTSAEPPSNGTANGADQRPRTLAETLEDIQLEQVVDQEGVDLLVPAEEVDDSCRLGITVAQPESGALRPALVIGVGSFGRRTLRELRCRLLDRLGELNKVPLFRFLYVDPDQEAIRDAVRCTPDVALSHSEVYPLPLQAATSYRRRMLDHLNEWLPREKLYAIPRSLQTQGSRALGRLAFVDHHLRFMARLRREVQQATHPDTLYQAVSQTGLALRDSVPQVYVIAAAGGGSSGFLVDLGYALRRLLHQMRHPEAEVNLLLFCGAPGDPATPPAEQGNIYATLTELNHFSDPSVPFAAQYGADGPRIVDSGSAFTCIYLLQLAHRSPDALRDLVAHLGSYLFHELMTPLGIRLSRERQLSPPTGATPFRSFGTYAVWFPRGLLLRVAARHVCRRLLAEWQEIGEPTAQLEVEAGCARVLADPELRPEEVARHIEETARRNLGGPAAETLTGMLAMLEEQSQQSLAQEDPAGWSRQALSRVLEWVGTGGGGSDDAETSVGASYGDWRQSRLRRALASAAGTLAETWAQRLAESAFELMQHPGRRVAASEAALVHFMHFCEESVGATRQQRERQTAQTQQAWQQLEFALEECVTGAGGSWGLSGVLGFGSRSRRSLRVFMDRLAAFARQCLAEELFGVGQKFFVLLQGHLAERVRDLTFSRQRLNYVSENLDMPADDGAEGNGAIHDLGLTPTHSPLSTPDAYWESIRRSATNRVVLPEAVADLEEAAARFAGRISHEVLAQLDQVLQDRVLAERNGLQAACSASGDVLRHLGLPLVEQTASFLGEHLPVTDVAEVELSDGADGELEASIRDSVLRAAPLVCGQQGARQVTFLLVPTSSAGKSYGEAAQRLVPELQLVRVPGQAHLMFCREQAQLSAEDLQRMLRPCHAIYEETARVPQISPHARFDISDWMPLDP
jgi:hypothetical protein